MVVYFIFSWDISFILIFIGIFIVILFDFIFVFSMLGWIRERHVIAFIFILVEATLSISSFLLRSPTLTNYT